MPWIFCRICICNLFEVISSINFKVMINKHIVCIPEYGSNYTSKGNRHYSILKDIQLLTSLSLSKQGFLKGIKKSSWQIILSTYLFCFNRTIPLCNTDWWYASIYQCISKILSNQKYLYYLSGTWLGFLYELRQILLAMIVNWSFYLFHFFSM